MNLDEKIEDLQNLVDSIVILRFETRVSVEINNDWGLAATFTKERKILISADVLGWSENARCGVTAHELAHILLKHHRSTTTRCEQETEADSLAVFLLNSIGLKGEEWIIARFNETPLSWQEGFDDRRQQLRSRTHSGEHVTG